MSERPEVLLKVALTLDGRVATASGSSKWITGEPARRRTHELRAECDAIAVGAGTVAADNPALTVRLAEGEHPTRVVFDAKGRSPADAALFHDGAAPTWVLGPAGVDAPGLAERVEVESTAGRIDLHHALSVLHARGVRSLMVEGGPTLHRAFIDAGLVDRVAAFVAPKFVGGDDAPGCGASAGVRDMALAPYLEDPTVTVLGQDVLFEGLWLDPRTLEE